LRQLTLTMLDCRESLREPERGSFIMIVVFILVLFFVVYPSVSGQLFAVLVAKKSFFVLSKYPTR
jgi:hypothetical protein